MDSYLFFSIRTEQNNSSVSPSRDVKILDLPPFCDTANSLGEGRKSSQGFRREDANRGQRSRASSRRGHPSSGSRIWSGGGAKQFSRDFADIAKQSQASEVINIGWGPEPALGPWKLLHF